MQKYPVRTTARAQLQLPVLEGLVREHFGAGRSDGKAVTSTYGALATITVWPDGRELAVETKMDPSVPPDVQAETIRRYNRFLEDATGFSSKERAKRLKKAATAADGRD